MTRALSRFALLVLCGLLGAARDALALDPTRHVSKYTVQAWTVEAGMPHNLVHRIVQTPGGYPRLGTWEGLAPFNSREFKTVETAGFPALRDDGVRGLALDHDSRGAIAWWRKTSAGAPLLGAIVMPTRAVAP